MNKTPDLLKHSLIVNFPWYLVDIIEGVDLNSVYKDDFAEVGVDNKFQGKYMTICKIVQTPSEYSRKSTDPNILAIEGQLVCVWSTAVEKFKILNYGEVSMIRNADVFLVIPQDTELYEKIISSYEK